MNFNEDSEKMFKDALDQLLLKDEIITDLQNQLNTERQENSNLRKKVNDLESKLTILEDHNELTEDNININFNFKQLNQGQSEGKEYCNKEKERYFNSSEGKIYIIL
jgi:hypothetical protein